MANYLAISLGQSNMEVSGNHPARATIFPDSATTAQHSRATHDRMKPNKDPARSRRDLITLALPPAIAVLELVEVAGIEPASFVASTGLLRAQCALSLLDPTGLAHEPV